MSQYVCWHLFLYAKKDGKWICTSIVSIQLNDKDVDQVDNGEVGIVTDIELEKGHAFRAEQTPFFLNSGFVTKYKAIISS